MDGRARATARAAASSPRTAPPGMRVGAVPILGAVALLLLVALRRHQPPARVIRKHQRHSRRAARNFFVGAPIDGAADADASALRRVARRASHDSGRGPELSLICSDADGAVGVARRPQRCLRGVQLLLTAHRVSGALLRAR